MLSFDCQTPSWMARPRYGLPVKPSLARDETRSRGELVFDGYVRVSCVGHRVPPRFGSPRQQEEQIRAYALARRYQIGVIHFDLDRSGSKRRRPALERALARMAKREVHGLIVTRLDRFSRSVVDALQLIAEIESAGASLVSIEDGFDGRTPLGRALSTILLALAELEAARCAEAAVASRRRSVARGVHRSTYSPTGYRRGSDGRLALDPQTAPIVAEAFRRRAAGATYSELAEFFDGAGLANGRGGRVWTAEKVYVMFQNPVYIGEAYSGTTRNTHAHQPLIRPAIWLAAHAASAGADATAHGTTLLAGLVRCRGCSQSLGHLRWRSGGYAYRCRYRYRGLCSEEVYVGGPELEEVIVDRFLRELDGRRPAYDLESRLVTAEARLLALEEQVESRRKWRSAYVDADNVGVADARAAVLSLWRRTQLAALPPARELCDRWDSLALSERRAILARGLECVMVAAGSRPLHERIELLFAGARRDWYPRKGKPWQRRSFEYARAALPETLTDAKAPCAERVSVV